ncbi:MAG TPA: hypothetical protein VFL64_18105 [Rhizobacter sp.]|nr:hypothetical protein [Rhizobacter sp.]
MKTFQIELQKVKAMSNRNGLVEARIDALVLPVNNRSDDNPSTTLSFSEETARVLMLLLKQQLAEVDGRKARSQR